MGLNLYNIVLEPLLMKNKLEILRIKSEYYQNKVLLFAVKGIVLITSHNRKGRFEFEM